MKPPDLIIDDGGFCIHEGWTKKDVRYGERPIMSELGGYVYDTVGTPLFVVADVTHHPRKTTVQYQV